ncbi:MAG: serine/threonine-protein kinase [Novosphingobium sp.]|uniref:serine/threonine-protein kinase n=1 Tax=Novosphingobium sp. TaxID=1874826 RepID=UPI002734140B|nr:serine/threonine-protein kinase [Novosphingobium sp.]MDP3550860.1 serine/threonine-protein kinase [Novosphingobium sp.]
MSDKNGQGSGDEPRTVFNPVPGEPTPPPAEGAAAGGVGNAGDSPWGNPPQEQPSAAPQPPEPAPPAQEPAPLAETEFPGMTSFPAATAGEPREVREGDVLNHLYQVRRFIARGGMGQVFEGVNINNEDERVAIKVILPHLARDPNVLAMFRKEARTLTRLSHSALVQYRTLAMEPQLGVFYIVTEYIDGRNLSDVLSTIEATPAQLVSLIRTLAEGLAVAHSLGAIHRDISPDNIMLEGGRLERAKVIDFGIAKDLDGGSQTIVGDGFAGKLNYVAPEQLGDFGRQVGSWTDVYSLGLTILALINKRDVNMGGSLVDAVDKRRAGPDLSPVPAEVRPVLEGMLKPNPADRLRTMEDVIAALSDRATAAAAPASKPPKVAKAPKAAPKPKPPVVAGSDEAKQRKMLIGAGAAAAVVLLGGLGYALSSGGDDAPTDAATSAAPAVPTGDPLKTAQAVLDGGLASVSCSWLDVSDLQVQGTDVALAVKGVAGRPVDAQNEIGKLLSAKGLRAASIDFSDVSQISPNDCGPIEAFRQIRGTGASHISVPQVKWELAPLPADDQDAGKLGAPVVLNIDLNGVAGDIAIIGLEDSGQMTFEPRLDRSALEAVKVSSDTYRYPLTTTHPGWTGVFLLYGNGPFDQSLLNGSTGSRSGDWAQRFLAEARSKGWQADTVWYKTVNERPD